MKKDKVREELADVLNYCILMADTWEFIVPGTVKTRSFFNRGIRKSFWKNLKKSIILEPNFNGVGIDLKNLFKK